jgi:hypothetical protein
LLRVEFYFGDASSSFCTLSLFPAAHTPIRRGSWPDHLINAISLGRGTRARTQSKASNKIFVSAQVRHRAHATRSKV